MIENMVQRSGSKSIKIDKICDVMWWTSGSSGFINAFSSIDTFQNQVELCTFKVMQTMLIDNREWHYQSIPSSVADPDRVIMTWSKILTF